MQDLAAALLSGDRLALSRLLTQIENNTQQGLAALDELFPHSGKAHLIGVTGAPGTGKSSLVNQLALQYRKQAGKSIAIVAVDPSSPFSGGAVLGDRVRMKDLGGDPGVFIRSMATRGSLGGLAEKTASFVQVFDAAGYEIVIIETVGAGQGEVDIARLAHTTIVVEAPGFGDDIQAIKAGILEIADILVINKADRPGVEHTEKALKMMLELGHPIEHEMIHHGQKIEIRAPAGITSIREDIWITPVLKTIALDGTGIPELVEEIDRHAGTLRRTGEWTGRERLRLTIEVENRIRESLWSDFEQRRSDETYQQVLQKVFDRGLSPWAAVKLLMNGRKK
jgi:LAO/AO transport system kinase